MSDSDSGSGRKRVLVPIVAIMMCAVAIIGVGYSLTSTVSSNDNSIGVDGLELNLYKGNTGNAELWDDAAIFGDCDIPYAVNTTTERNSKGVYETTTEYIMTPGEVALNDSPVYLGINKTFATGDEYTITMNYNIVNSISGSGLKLYLDDSATPAVDADKSTDGIQFVITKQYTKITLKIDVPGSSASEPVGMEVDVNFSVTSA